MWETTLSYYHSEVHLCIFSMLNFTFYQVYPEYYKNTQITVLKFEKHNKS